MKSRIILFLVSIVVFVNSCSQTEKDDFVLVKGGLFVNTKSNYYGKDIEITDFYISKYEVSQKDWIEVMGNNPSEFKGDNLPVETITWYDCIEFCNKKSLKSGLKPYYHIDKNKKDLNNNDNRDDIKWEVSVDNEANGYRLPKVTEWEYASGGGQLSKSYTYSGSNDLDKVAWYWINSGDKVLSGFWAWSIVQKNNCKTKPIGSKDPNELGLYNMSGNVREWCWDWQTNANDPTKERCWRGGGWAGGDFCCESSYEGSYAGNSKGSDEGLRLCRNKK
jgi:formylglycine-generating enzyme